MILNKLYYTQLLLNGVQLLQCIIVHVVIISICCLAVLLKKIWIKTTTRLSHGCLGPSNAFSESKPDPKVMDCLGAICLRIKSALFPISASSYI